ncbi:MAG: signal recognition particle protein [Gemmataceae bacterium]|nr:signal recognition particle protein [Gemmataceae bacterium]MCI0738893.1 signal recognition particle protein [Gemmataceae bacterium]
MFETITRGLTDALKMLRGRGRLTEANMRDGLRQVRTALLEADVNFNVANEFIERVTQTALGKEVLRSLDPSEQIIQIIYTELAQLMGPVDHRFHFAKDRPTVIMLCGLQGSGKTTTAGKLALLLRDKLGRKPMLVAADLQRPAAVDQLKVLGEQLGIAVYSEGAAVPGGKGPNPISVCQNALTHAKKTLLDTVILDTAGRLHIAEMPMDELKQIDRLVKPDDVFLVCDAMTGQDAVNSSKAFNDALDLNGVILTKLDGDARGGAALSIKEVTKVPIKYIGVGEKLQALEEFHPDRMAQRILGHGDIMGIVEKVQRVQQQLSQEEIQKQQEKLEKGNFTLDDFRKQFETIAKMGNMKELMAQMPGMGQMIPEGEDPDVAVRRIQGMIDSMTKKERRDPDLIDLSRRRRIADGSGTQPHEVKQFLNQFDQVRAIMRQMAQMSMWQRMKMIMGMGKSGMFDPGAMMPKTKIGTGHRKSPKERADERKKKRKQDKRR